MTNSTEMFVNELVKSTSGIVICNSAPENISLLEVELGNRDITLIWLDAYRTISDKNALAIAFHTAFHYYGETRSLDAVADYLTEVWYVPYRACIVLISDTGLLRQHGAIYDALKDLLQQVSMHWRLNGYVFRSILIENDEIPA